MTTRGIRRKKSYLVDAKVTIYGKKSVGKSALAVRFLTKRYIGDYDHQGDKVHKHEILVDGDAVLAEIWDTCMTDTNDSVSPKTEPLSWCDGLLLVYSITDRDSFNFVKKVKQDLQSSDTPIILIGNKADLIHLRQVSTEEGEILAKDFDCKFHEVSAADQITNVNDAFFDMLREILQAKRKSKQSFIEKIDRMLGGTGRVYNRGKSDSAAISKE